tara:strand:+ start:2425 stop:3414 length:990 start_codon:yes stop_codon:yes gene_type:complete
LFDKTLLLSKRFFVSKTPATKSRRRRRRHPSSSLIMPLPLLLPTKPLLKSVLGVKKREKIVTKNVSLFFFVIKMMRRHTARPKHHPEVQPLGGRRRQLKSDDSFRRRSTSSSSSNNNNNNNGRRRRRRRNIELEELEKSYEIPQSTVLRLEKHDIDIRVVEPHAVAITPYENREEGLARLTMYMDGENATGEQYPPTQPLTMRYALDEEETIVGKTMELYLGPRVAETTTTTNDDDGVVVLAAKTNEKTRTISTRIAGGEVMAVMPLVGMATEDAARKCRDVIAREVEKTGAFRVDRSGFRVSAFGPMYSLKPRNNEVSVKVTPIIVEK